MPASATAASAAMSTTLPTPPDARTGIPAALASAIVSYVRPTTRAVTTHVGVEQRGETGRGALLVQREHELDRRQARELDPTLERHLPISRVDGDDDAAPEAAADLIEKVRLERPRADDDPVRTRVEHRR